MTKRPPTSAPSAEKQPSMPCGCARSLLQTGKVWRWSPVVAWAAVILALTSIPGANLPPPPTRHFDLLVHGGLYAVLGFLLLRAFFMTTRPGGRRTAWCVALFVGVLYGVFDELHQILIPNRSCALADIVADGLGVVLGVAAYQLTIVRRTRPADEATSEASE